jgi:4-carboxymuconolactone decarboxylase
MSSRRDRGIAVYARVFGIPSEDVPASIAERVGAAFTAEALHAAGGPAWSDPALTSRDRSLAVITARASQGIADDRLRTHVRLGRGHRIDERALIALAMLLAVYVGYPRASLAMETILDECASLGRTGTENSH